ncbi:MAG: hypothetical protein LBH54_03830 [Clostridiales bacterium]|jgi:hypothetical protein|nr:hypothetical protein [Clostridiales bacterium]
MAFTANYQIEETPCGTRFTFLCDVTGKPVCTTPPIRANSPEEALAQARSGAREYFNRCQRCNRWISDDAYDIDEMVCVKCKGNLL